MLTKNTQLTKKYPAETAALILITGGLSIVIALTWLCFMGRRYRVNKKKPRLIAPVLVCGCPPGPALTGRIQAAQRLMISGQATECIISGRGEAEHGQAMLISLGIDIKRLKVETEATNTLENLLNVGAILEKTRSWVVSDAWHLPRVLWIAKQLNYDLMTQRIYLTQKQALKAERRLAERLRKQGYTVEGGH